MGKTAVPAAREGAGREELGGVAAGVTVAMEAGVAGGGVAGAVARLEEAAVT